MTPTLLGSLGSRLLPLQWCKAHTPLLLLVLLQLEDKQTPGHQPPKQPLAAGRPQ
jgi:hypothetical protein